MVEKKENAKVSDTEDDDIDIDLDYLLEEGLEVAEKKEAKAKDDKKELPTRKPAAKKSPAKAGEKKETAKKEKTPVKKASGKAAPKKDTEKTGKKEKARAPKKEKAETPKKEKKQTAKKEKAPAKAEKKEKEDVLVVEDEEEEGVYVAKLKPALPDEVLTAMKEREYRKRRKPDFKRQEWFRYKRLGTAWRRPRGIQSKMRRHFNYRPNIVSVGYGTNKIVRGRHPSGFEEVLVYRPLDLEGMDPTLQAARIGHGVGSRKREMIEKRARELGIRVLNRSG